MDLRAGSRLHSAVCATEVVVVRPPAGEATLECGGQAMLPIGAEESARSGDVAPGSGTLLGKRYVDAGETVEVLCTKAGAGSLAIDGEPLAVKAAKPLPSSD